MIRFDFGCTMDGYTSDLARTAVAGEPSPKIRDYYEALKRGTLDAIAIIKPGVIAQDIFKVAVDSTIRNGLAGYERHHCGHGIGLEIYDLPSVAPGCETPIEENMTLCIETPYYELGWGGLQIEHTVAVTRNGTRRLDKTSSDLIVLNA
jgi:Xaa-Pro aminopeptidase